MGKQMDQAILKLFLDSESSEMVQGNVLIRKGKLGVSIYKNTEFVQGSGSTSADAVNLYNVLNRE